MRTEGTWGDEARCTRHLQRDGPPAARARPSCGPRVSLTELLFVLGIALSRRVAVFYNASFLFAGRRNSVQVFMTRLHSSNRLINNLYICEGLVSSKTFDSIEMIADKSV